MEEGARQAIETCLKVGPEDKVVITTDVHTMDIGAALLERAKRHAKVSFFILEDFDKRPMNTLPKPIADALNSATVSILAAQSMEGEMQNFRKPYLDIITNKKIRHAHMVGVNQDIMNQGMAADYEQVKAFSKKVHGLLQNVKQIHVTSRKGTDFSVEISLPWIISDGHITQEQWSNLPDGEVWTIASNVEGRIVIDGVLGDYFSQRYGILEQSPLIIHVKNSRVTKVISEFETLKEDFSRYLKTDENSDRVGEFAFGTNLALKNLVGNMLQDEKFPGVHFAIGHAFPSRFGSTWSSKVHCDAVLQYPTVIVDGNVLMKDGRYLI